jgi:hypothetical protein
MGCTKARQVSYTSTGTEVIISFKSANNSKPMTVTVDTANGIINLHKPGLITIDQDIEITGQEKILADAFRLAAHFLDRKADEKNG